MKIDLLDHLVLTVHDINATCHFYTQFLGMTIVTFGKERKALHFGNQKINLHEYDHEFEPKTQTPTPGSADLYFVTSTPLAEVIAHAEACQNLLEGSATRTGTTGQIRSIYVRDPDQNLIKLS